MEAIPAAARHLFEGRSFAHLATLNPDGSPQVSPVWVGIEGETVVVIVNDGLVKTRNLRHDPRVALSIANQENPYENVLVQGRAVELTREGADAGADSFANRYLGFDEYPRGGPGEELLKVRIEAARVQHTVLAGANPEPESAG